MREKAEKLQLKLGLRGHSTFQMIEHVLLEVATEVRKEELRKAIEECYGRVVSADRSMYVDTFMAGLECALVAIRLEAALSAAPDKGGK